MAKEITYESDDYIKTITFGPGLNFEWKMRLKTYDENLEYRKKNGLDVYDDNDVLVDKCEKHGRSWVCYIEPNKSTSNVPDNRIIGLMFGQLDEMAKINRYLKDQYPNLPQLGCIVVTGDRLYYNWNFGKKGYFIRNEVHDEIKIVAQAVNQYYVSIA
jgi:hypothetical protein